MTSLPERLRSAARAVEGHPREIRFDHHVLLTEAADELDRRAVRIQWLEYRMRQIRGAVEKDYLWADEPPDQADAPDEKLLWTEADPAYRSTAMALARISRCCQELADAARAFADVVETKR